MNLHRRWHAGCFVAALMAGNVWVQASAQNTAGENEEDELEPIIVTARRVGEDIERVPVSINALGGDELEQRRVVEPQDLNFAQSGLTVDQSSAIRGQDTFTIRGQGQAFGVAQPGVVAYFADVSGLSTYSFYDLENLQVLKGPQGTLFGRNTTGGAVLFVPKQPTDELSGYATVRVGDYNDHEFEGAVSGPIIPDVLLVRVSGQLRYSDGFTTNLFDGQHLDNTDRQSGRVYVRFEPTDWVANDTIFVIDRINESGSGNEIQSVIAQGNAIPFLPQLSADLAAQQARGPRVADLDNPGFFRVNQNGVANTTTVKPTDNLTLKNIFGYRRNNTSMSFDSDGTPLPLQETFPGPLGFSPMTQLDEELQLQGKGWHDRFNWILGGYYEDDNTPDIGGGRFFTYVPDPYFILPPAVQSKATPYGPIVTLITGLPPPFPASLSGQGALLQSDLISTSHSNSKAVFFHTDIGLTDSLRLSGGVRRTWDYYSSQSYNIPTLLDDTPVAVGGPLSGSSAATTYEVALNDQLTDGLMLYVTSRKGYRGGGTNSTAPLNRPDLAQYKPEYIQDVEVGAKSRWRIGNVQGVVNVDGYYDWYSDIQTTQLVTGVGGAAATVTANAARAIIRGIDVDATVVPAHWLELSLTYTLTDAFYTSYPSQNATTLLPVSLVNDVFEDTPKQKFTFTPTVKLPIDPAWGKLSVQAQVYYQSDMTFLNETRAADPSSFIDPYALVNLRVDFADIRHSTFRLSAFVTNLANKTYQVGEANLLSTAAFGTNAVLYGAPRMYGVEAHYQFK